MSVVVFGGTGHLGQDVVRLLRARGFAVRVASRQGRPSDAPAELDWATTDLATGAGLDEAVRGVETIIFAAGHPKDHRAVEVDGMRRLVAAASKAGTRHLIFVSIVGIDRLPVPYYRTKLEAEQILHAGAVPFSILRATQFHYFVDMLLGALARVPLVLPIPRGFWVQPVDTADVAARLLRCVSDGPRGLLPDFCGPEVLALKDAAAIWKRARGIRKPVVAIPIPGAAGAAFRAGYNTNGEGELGGRRWGEWVASRYG